MTVNQPMTTTVCVKSVCNEGYSRNYKGQCVSQLAAVDASAKLVKADVQNTTELSNELIKASGEGDLASVRYLLTKGADVNARNTSPVGETALIAASQKGHFLVVEALLDKGADVNAQSNDGATALKVASAHGHQKVVDRLIKAWAK